MKRVDLSLELVLKYYEPSNLNINQFKEKLKTGKWSKLDTAIIEKFESKAKGLEKLDYLINHTKDMHKYLSNELETIKILLK